MFLNDVYICNLCYELIEGREVLSSHYRTCHHRRYVVANKLPVHICKSCGSLFLHRRYGKKIPQDYCCQPCYLESANPFNDPKTVALKVLPRLLRGENNPSKRPEVRAIISAKLTGRDAWWMRGSNSVAKRASVREAIRANALKRWGDPKIRASLLVCVRDGGMFGWSVEGSKHLSLKHKVLSALESKGYVVSFEVPVKAGEWYIVDVLGKKESETVAVECGDCKKEKITALKSVFNKVFHVSYKNKIEEVLVL